MHLTKIEKSRVIVKALYNVKHLPAEDNVHVKRIAKGPGDHIEEMYQLAVAMLKKKTT